MLLIEGRKASQVRLDDLDCHHDCQGSVQLIVHNKSCPETQIDSLDPSGKKNTNLKQVSW